MELERTRRFTAAYRLLEPATRQRVQEALRTLLANPRHPSLHLKRMRRQRDVWEVRVDRQNRMTFEIHQSYYLLRNVGKHDETLEIP